MKQFVLSLLALSLSVTALAEKKPHSIEVQFKENVTIPAKNGTRPTLIHGSDGAMCAVYNHSDQANVISAGQKKIMREVYWGSESSWTETTDIGVAISCSGPGIGFELNGSELVDGSMNALRSKMSSQFNFKIIEH